jgi:hypothetical protein
MRPIALVLIILPLLGACATRSVQEAAGSQKAIDAVTQDESQRQKVLAAIRAGDTPTEAMAKVADGPKLEKDGPKSPPYKKGRRLAAPALIVSRGSEEPASVLRRFAAGRRTSCRYAGLFPARS